MSEAKSTEESSSRRGRWGCVAGYSVLAFLFLGISGALVVVLETAYHLVAGWLFYLGRVIPEIRWNLPMIASGVMALALATIGFHFVARGFLGKWQKRWTGAWVLAGGLLFFSSILTTGIVHQMSWLTKEEYATYYSASMLRTKDRSRFRSILWALGKYKADHGEFPEALSDLYPHYIDISQTDREDFWGARVGKDQYRSLLYFPEADSLSEDSGLRWMLFASPGQPEINMVGFADGIVEPVAKSDFEKLLAEQIAATFAAFAEGKASGLSE